MHGGQFLDVGVGGGDADRGKGDGNVDVLADRIGAGLALDGEFAGGGAADFGGEDGVFIEAPTEPAEFRVREVLGFGLIPRAFDVEAGGSDLGLLIDADGLFAGELFVGTALIVHRESMPAVANFGTDH